ncbi:hypothetical protein AX16_007718 [Volvariella volvacea WC 439]|nr:hypothetical protein AX16_007718 [Volvariella volvacea WC 439]
MDGLAAEIRKIPPVTRFLCGSSLGVTLPVLLNIVSPYSVVFVKEFVFKKLQVWRLWSSFFLGGSGINYIFEMSMLYHTASQLEVGPYARRSADLAWQLMIACGSIVAMSLPLRAFVFSRPLLVCLVYISSSLAPAGAQTSLMGLVTLPVKYMPYMMIGLDLLMAGAAGAAQSVAGAVVGHFWWWSIWGSNNITPSGPFAALGTAPQWLRKMMGEDGSSSGGAAGGAGASASAPRNIGGVQVIPPRRDTRPSGGTSGHNWGSGQRLGSN